MENTWDAETNWNSPIVLLLSLASLSSTKQYTTIASCQRCDWLVLPNKTASRQVFSIMEGGLFLKSGQAKVGHGDKLIHPTMTTMTPELPKVFGARLLLPSFGFVLVVSSHPVP